MDPGFILKNYLGRNPIGDPFRIDIQTRQSQWLTGLAPPAAKTIGRSILKTILKE
jgi:hypothetical protein